MGGWASDLAECGPWGRHFPGDSRDWICQKSSGREVAIGTGPNLPTHPLPDGIELTGPKLIVVRN
jgi:hypothetical protein